MLATDVRVPKEKLHDHLHRGGLGEYTRAGNGSCWTQEKNFLLMKHSTKHTLNQHKKINFYTGWQT
jgi:hypothetical protein